MEQCPFCKDILSNGEQLTRLTEKGCTSIRVAADQRNEQVTVKSGQNVHTVCRQQFTNKNVIKKDVTPKKMNQLKGREIELRSPQTKFSFKEQCLFCTQRVALEKKNSKLNNAFNVRTVELKDTLIKKCEERGKTDEWSNSVMARLVMVNDLHAADAAYHQLCSVNFRTGKQIPSRFLTIETPPHVKHGRPEDPEQANAFLEIVDYIVKNEDEQISLVNLVDLMKSFCGDKAFRSSYMKKKILDHFGDSVFIADMNGTENIVMFRQMASNILKKYYNKEKKTEVEEKTAIIEAAAQFVRSEIKSMTNTKMFYPTKDDVASQLNNINFVPETLRFFLRSVTGMKEDTIKIASIGQSIVQATRPKSILAPLQIGLGIQCHHHYASKFLIDTLYRLGFSSSYKEVQLFEANAAKQHASDQQHTLPSGHFVQFVADNIDHNLRTLDGHNTFHGMGMMSGFSPAVMYERRIRRQYVSTNEITELGRINIMSYCAPGEISMDNFRSINLPETYIDERDPFHLLPNLVWCLRSPTPGWSGFMQMVEDGPHPGKSSFTFLPIIDLNPSDMSCIYSTLHYINNLARKYNVTPTLTFDQPLYWKAKIIVANERDDIYNIFLRLGGFHIQLSFLGSIGHLMGGSGLKELLECVYAPNAVTHMISGKAVSRAIRGHMLVDKVLHALVIERIYSVTVTVEDFRSDNGETNNITPLPSGDLREIVELYDHIQVSNSLNPLHDSTVLKRIQGNIEKEKSNLRKYRTASIWFMYMDMVMLLRGFITAERTGNWKAHIHTLQKMLPYFAASGHNNYTKSVNLYLQDAVNLTTSKPDVFNFFSNGHHVLRRSDRYWAGLSTDLIIEQTLMRSCKTTGGMTRGRGMTEHQRAHWLLSMPACAEINVAMQDLLGIDFQTSEQHKECSVARMARDQLDSQKLLSFLKTRNPFDEIESLRNIESGDLASEKVNADSSLELGNRIIETMENQSPLMYTFKRTRQAVTLAADTHILKIDGENVHIDPQLLFQRLLTAANVQDEPLKLFEYELCTYPPSLFDDSGLMRLAKKSALADALWGLCNITDISLPTSPIQYVLDGGSLIHKIPWSSGSFQYICNSYVGYLWKRYTTTTIVFDGYPACSTKDTWYHWEICAVHTRHHITIKERTISIKHRKQS